jgi:hypothetical protein
MQAYHLLRLLHKKLGYIGWTIMYFIKKLWYDIIFKFRKPKIEVYSANFSGNNSLIDIRYWISRPDKINPKGPVYLIHNDSGKQLSLIRIAKFGPIHTHHNNRYKNTGIMLFYNRDSLVKPGNIITVYLDNLVAGNIEVK